MQPATGEPGPAEASVADSCSTHQLDMLRETYRVAKAAFHCCKDTSSREKCRLAKIAYKDALANSTEPAASTLLQASPGMTIDNACLVFDLNYQALMTAAEAGSLCRQLTLSYAANSRAARPFQLCMGGADIMAPDNPPELGRVLTNANWQRWTGVNRVDSTEPWERCPHTKVVYLTADSPNELQSVQSDTTYVIGGVVDRTDKPGVSFARAEAGGHQTARLPLDSFLKLHSRQCGGEGSADLTTLAVVQMLLLFRETSDWGLAISRCPALRSAPLRKYIRWLPPYEHLNGCDRPPDPLIRGSSAEYEAQDLVKVQRRELNWS